MTSPKFIQELATVIKTEFIAYTALHAQDSNECVAYFFQIGPGKIVKNENQAYTLEFVTQIDTDPLPAIKIKMTDDEYNAYRTENRTPEEIGQEIIKDATFQARNLLSGFNKNQKALMVMCVVL